MTGERPVLQVVRGEPTPAELAALLVVVSARRAGGPLGGPPRPSPWNDPARQVRAPIRPDADGWRRSALPR